MKKINLFNKTHSMHVCPVCGRLFPSELTLETSNKHHFCLMCACELSMVYEMESWSEKDDNEVVLSSENTGKNISVGDIKAIHKAYKAAEAKDLFLMNEYDDYFNLVTAMSVRRLNDYISSWRTIYNESWIDLMHSKFDRREEWVKEMKLDEETKERLLRMSDPSYQQVLKSVKHMLRHNSVPAYEWSEEEEWKEEQDFECDVEENEREMM